MADIFLSYNREDQQKAKLIAKSLESEGFDVWWDTVLRAGQTYDEVTEKQLRDAKAVVVLWSARSVRSKWVRAEATLGDRKSALIPVMIEYCDRPIMFELIQTADLTQWEGDVTEPNWRAFIADVHDHIQRKRSAAEAPPPAEPPAEAQAPQIASTHVDDAETIEVAFWTSVRDGDDPSDFAAYLERYPHGHFAPLAQKRLQHFTEAAPAAAPPPQQPPPPPPQPTPAMKVEAASREPPPPPRVAVSQKQDRSPKRGGSMPLMIGVAVLGAILIAAFAFWPRAPEAPAPVDVAAPVQAQAAPPTAVVSDTAPEATVVRAQQGFRDCPDCPAMVRLEGGPFWMGSPDSEPGRRPWEGPLRQVQIAPFAIGEREVTFAEWDACVADGGCNLHSPPDRGWGRGEAPVMMVSWNDAQAYVRWLNGKSDRSYRLPSEAEWEFAARGDKTTAYWWGATFDASRVALGRTSATGAHEANAFGLFDVTGNVAEWVEDCYVSGFTNAPSDGRAVSAGNCNQRVVRGGSWRDDAQGLRIASRIRVSRATRDGAIGFRVAASAAM